MADHDHYALLYGRQGIVQHLQEEHREFYQSAVMGVVGVAVNSDRLFALHDQEHAHESPEGNRPATEISVPHFSPTASGPVARVMAYEGTTMLFDQLVHQNIATRQIFTHNHVRPDGSMLAVVVELPETYPQPLPSVETDLSQVSVYDLLDEIRRRVESLAAEYGVSDGTG